MMAAVNDDNNGNNNLRSVYALVEHVSQQKLQRFYDNYIPPPSVSLNISFRCHHLNGFHL